MKVVSKRKKAYNKFLANNMQLSKIYILDDFELFGFLSCGFTTKVIIPTPCSLVSSQNLFIRSPSGVDSELVVCQPLLN